MKPTFDEVQDAIGFIELHSFRGTSLVACCITMKDKRVVLGTACVQEGHEFDISDIAAKARAAAEKQVALELEAKPLTVA